MFLFSQCNLISLPFFFFFISKQQQQQQKMETKVKAEEFSLAEAS